MRDAAFPTGPNFEHRGIAGVEERDVRVSLIAFDEEGSVPVSRVSGLDRARKQGGQQKAQGEPA
jgi:hypothetical protein